MPKLSTLQRRVQKLQAEIERAESKRRAKLLDLPKKYGFASIEAVVEALQSLSPSKGGLRGRPAGRAAGKRIGKRTRARITDAMRAQVKTLAGAGKTGAEIAKAVGISLPSVQNIKKAAGLVKARK